MAGIEFHVEGMPGVRRMLDTYSPRQLQNRMRRVVRAGAKPFQGGIKAEAASHHGGGRNVPLSFQKVPAPKVSTRGGVSGRDIEAYVRPKSPLFNVFEPDASGHTIAPRKKALRGPAGSAGWTQAGRKRRAAFFSRRAVHHPGFGGRQILPGAFQSRLGAAEMAVAAALFNP